MWTSTLWRWLWRCSKRWLTHVTQTDVMYRRIDQHTFLASKNNGQQIEPELCTSDMGIVIKSISLEKKKHFSLQIWWYMSCSRVIKVYLLLIKSSERKLLIIWFQTSANFVGSCLSSLPNFWKEESFEKKNAHKGKRHLQVVQKMTWTFFTLNIFFSKKLKGIRFLSIGIAGGTRDMLKASGKEQNRLLTIPIVRI